MRFVSIVLVLSIICLHITMETSGEVQKHKGAFSKIKARLGALQGPIRSNPARQQGVSFLIGLGVQKGGTTALAAMLARFSWIDAYGPEMHFFDTAMEPTAAFIGRFGSGALFREYRSHWRYPNLVKFEKTPRYIRDYPVAYRIRETIPNSASAGTVKFVLMLRDPVSRTYSGVKHTALVARRDNNRQLPPLEQVLAEEIELVEQCKHHLHFEQQRKENTSAGSSSSRGQLFECGASAETRWRDFLACESRVHTIEGYSDWDSIAIRGMYADELKNFLCAGFQPEQFIFIMNHELLTDPKSVILRIADFAGATLSADDHAVLNLLSPTTRSPSIEDRPFQQELTSLFAEDVQDLYNLLRSYDFVVDLPAFRREFKHWSFAH